MTLWSDPICGGSYVLQICLREPRKGAMSTICKGLSSAVAAVEEPVLPGYFSKGVQGRGSNPSGSALPPEQALVPGRSASHACPCGDGSPRQAWRAFSKIHQQLIEAARQEFTGSLARELSRVNGNLSILSCAITK